MRSSAVHTPLLDDSVANAAQAEALRQEGNELFKVGSYTALFHFFFFVSGSLSSGKQVVARERLGVAVPTRSIPLHC